MTVKSSTAAASALVLGLIIGVSAAHAGDGSSSVRLFDLKPFKGNPFGIIARAKPKTNPWAPSRIMNIRPDPDATRHPAGVMTKGGVVKAGDNRRDFGSFGIPYTTTRVQEGARGVDAEDANRLSTTYPYSAVGAMVFSKVDTGCSASVIRRGIVVTAAHCVIFFQEFEPGEDGLTGDVDVASIGTFVPAFYNGEGATDETRAPYGEWPAFRGAIPNVESCFDFNENDVAVLAVGKNDAGQFVGDLVGTLGYAWNNYSFVKSELVGELAVGAVTTLGYPGLMDKSSIMQRTDGPTYATIIGIDGSLTPGGEDSSFGCEDGEAKVLMQGSNLTSGSSGGPWVVNFSGRSAELGEGAEPGEAPLMAAIGVTSFGSLDPNEPKDNFASQFAQNSQFPEEDYGGYGAGNIGALMQAICESEAPEGGTLKSQGYCD